MYKHKEVYYVVCTTHDRELMDNGIEKRFFSDKEIGLKPLSNHLEDSFLIYEKLQLKQAS